MTTDTTDPISLALLAALAWSDGDHAAGKAFVATARRACTRNRHVVELAELVVGGDRGRAADLAAVHVDTYPDDAELVLRLAGVRP
jgi:hypothetical protein